MEARPFGDLPPCYLFSLRWIVTKESIFKTGGLKNTFSFSTPVTA
jgi:hypothetical protein